MLDEGKSLVASPDVWLIVTLLFAIALCDLIGWLFSDVELEFAGGDRLDRSVRKRLGIAVLATAALSLIMMLVLVLHVGFFRYWVGAVCYLIAANLLFGALRQFRGIG
jgi:hypothetical protein